MRDDVLEYVPRHPEETTLYQVVAQELETFLHRQQERDRPVPHFVEEEFRSFLDCGVLARGFLRLRCQKCRHDRLLPFSCKRRGICSSCGGRRMADTAAHLVDRVIPIVPVRQWVLSMPFPLRYRMAYDAALLTDVLTVFIRALFGELQRRARPVLDVRPSKCGAVTFVQRWGDALNANPHFHCLALDGVYSAGDNGQPEFHRLPAPENDDVLRLAELVAQCVESLLKRRGLGPEAEAAETDPLSGTDPGMAALLASSPGDCDRTVIGIAGWAVALSFETSMARRNQRCHLRTTGFHRQTGRVSAGASRSPYPVSRNLGALRCMETMDRSIGQQQSSGRRNRTRLTAAGNLPARF
jgi:hypothetical protein